MKGFLKEKITNITGDKLTNEQIEDLADFFKQALSNNLDYDDESFFKKFAYDMTGGLKELALLIIDFRKDLKSKVTPEITDLATKYIPQATDQLESVIKTTEIAANKIMDNLDTMQRHSEKLEEILISLKGGEIDLPGRKKESIDSQTIKAIYPIINYIEPGIKKHMSLISDSFVQMSFQDLTGQRIGRIITLVSQMEIKLKEMIISFGIKLTEIGKKPDISKDELQKVIDVKVSELTGPQMPGQGLDQEGIDELLANL